MHSAVNHNLIARIAEFSLPSGATQALTNQDEWHEFLPLSFLLVQSMRPQRILEVGTRIGDSYLSFCQAVESYSLSTQCRCIPQVKSILEREAARQWQEFQWKHDSLFFEVFAHRNAHSCTRRNVPLRPCSRHNLSIRCGIREPMSHLAT